MSSAPRSSQIASQEAAEALLSRDRGYPSRGARGFLSPFAVEAAVATIDILVIISTGLLCSAAYHWITGGALRDATPYGGLGVIAAVNFVAIMAARQNYRLKNLVLFRRQATQVIVAWTCLYGLLALVAFTMKISSDFSRGAVILFFVGGLTTLAGWRQIVAKLVSRSLTDGLFAKRRIIIVAEEEHSDLSRTLLELRSYGLSPVETYEISGGELKSVGTSTALRAKLDDLIRFARREHVQDVYLILDWHHDRAIEKILSALSVLPISVHLLPDSRTARFLNYPNTHIGNARVALLKRAPLSRFELAGKRFFDIIFATAGLLVMLPLMLVAALFIKLDSRGPIFFRQHRNGFNGQTFNIIKFRTMHVLENGPEIKQATRDDPRVTRVGRLLRRSSIDELPQLLNVIHGKMSLVGPRPHAISHNSEYEEVIANYAFRHHVKPGLTGWAQVSGHRGETRSLDQMKLRIEHDLWYINNWSPWLDLKIISRTIAVTLWQTTAY